jgi:hypothetical protein
VKFELQQTDNVSLQVFDLKGQLIFTHEEHFNAGHQQIKINADQFPATGTYLYRLLGNDLTLTKKLMVIQ